MDPPRHGPALLPLVGREVEYGGRVHVVVEILETPWALVLESRDPSHRPDIQTDSLGYPHRMTPHQEVIEVENELGQIDFAGAGIRLL